MDRTLRIGVIGASATGGWTRDSHAPAIRAVAGLELVAVATASQSTANAAAEAFGVAKAYAGGQALIADADVDVVVVATRVPEHRELVLAAVAAGKHVYCEWPLGRGLTEAKEMAMAARSAGVHTAIGLQLRASPTVAQASVLLASGAIGRLLSVTISSSTAGFGPNISSPFLYLEDPSNFANLVTIQAAHTVDLAIAVAGELETLNALATTMYPVIRAGDAEEARERSTFDHLLLQARLSGGAVLAVAVAGGRSPDTPFWLEAVGETGILRLDGGAPRGVQSGTLVLSVDGQTHTLRPPPLGTLPKAAVDVANVYSRLRDDIHHSQFTCAGFDHAVDLTQLVEDVLESSRTGRRACKADRPGCWPSGVEVTA